MEIKIQTPETGINWGVEVPILKSGTSEKVGYIKVDVNDQGDWAFFVFDQNNQIHPSPLPSYHSSKLVAEYHFQRY